MRILIADDEMMSRRLLQETLVRAGNEVTAVENGRLALEHLCPVDGPRLALLDWEMPEMNGPGVCREVRKGKSNPMSTWCCSHPRSRKKTSSRAWNPGPMIPDQTI